MENEMVERVAAAIIAEMCASRPDEPPGIRLARAAIEAMREPTLQMVQAGWAVNGYRGDMTEREWSAMIDVALKQPA